MLCRVSILLTTVLALSANGVAAWLRDVVDFQPSQHSNAAANVQKQVEVLNDGHIHTKTAQKPNRRDRERPEKSLMRHEVADEVSVSELAQQKEEDSTWRGMLITQPHSWDCSTDDAKLRFRLLEKFTYSAWIMFDDQHALPDRVTIFGGGHTDHFGDQNFHGFYLKSNGEGCDNGNGKRYSLHAGLSGRLGTYHTPICHRRDTWYHVAATRNSTHHLSFYVNGVKVGDVKAPDNTDDPPVPKPDHLSCTLGDTSGSYLYNVQLWTEPLPRQDIICAATKLPSEIAIVQVQGGLIRWWPLKEDTKCPISQDDLTRTAGGDTTFRHIPESALSDFAAAYASAQCTDNAMINHNEPVSNPGNNPNMDWEIFHVACNENFHTETTRADKDDPSHSCCINQDVHDHCPDFGRKKRIDPDDDASGFPVTMGTQILVGCCDMAKYCNCMKESFVDKQTVLLQSSSPRVNDMQALYEYGSHGSTRVGHARAEATDTHIKSLAEVFRRHRDHHQKLRAYEAEKVENDALLQDAARTQEGSGGCSPVEKKTECANGEECVASEMKVPLLPEPTSVEMIMEIKNPERGSLSVPLGWDATYSTDGGSTFRPQEPIEGITHMKLIGSYPDAPGAAIPIPRISPPPMSQKGSGGDGFFPMVVGRRVFNVGHHSGGTRIVCMMMDKQASGDQLCKNYATGGAAGWQPNVGIPTSNAPTGMQDSAAQKLYIPSTGKFVIVDVKDGAVPTATDLAVPGAGQLGAGSPCFASMRLYSVSQATSSKIFCLDVSDPAAVKACKGFPFDVGFKVQQVATMALSYRVIAAGAAQSSCFEINKAGDPVKCAGWPATIPAGNAAGFPLSIQDENGMSIGFCVFSPVKCFNLNDGSVGTGPLANFVAKIAGFPAPTSFNYVTMPFFKSRSYFWSGNFDANSKMICWDGKKGDICDNYPKVRPQASGFYGLGIDPSNNGGCMWGVGCAGMVSSWSTKDPSKSCGSDAPTIVVSPANCYCPGSNQTTPDKWKSARIINLPDDKHGGVSLVITDKADAEVENIEDFTTEVDLTSHAIGEDAETLSFKIRIVAPAADLFDNPRKMPTLIVLWDGAEECQVCIAGKEAAKPKGDAAPCNGTLIALAARDLPGAVVLLGAMFMLLQA